MVSADELLALERTPSGINTLDQPVCASTHFAASLNFFLTGTAYPDGAVNTLGAALSGSRSVEAPTLENGAFYVTETAAIPDVVRALTSVDRDALRASVASADLASLVEDEELYDLELLDDAEVPDAIVSELDALLAFYVQVDTAGGAVVSYTT